MYKQILVLILLIAVSNAELSGWRNCGSHHAIVHAVRMTGCTQTPCRFIMGNTYTAEVDGTWLGNSNTLPFAMTIIIFGLPVTLLEGDACDYKTYGQCPSLNGNRFTFTSNYPVPANLPPVSTVVTGIIYNDFGNIAVCLEIDVTVA